MDKYQFGEFIYQKRKELKITQDELGRKLGVTNKAVSKWETGETLPDINLLEMLASALHVSIDELLTQKKPEKEIRYKQKKAPIIISIVMGALAFILSIVLFIDVFSEIEKEELLIENFDEYFVLTPCSKSEIDGTAITIYGNVEKLTNKDLSFIVRYVIRYYYLNDNGKKSEITYVNRDYVFDGSTTDFSIRLEPKNDLSNFESFLGFDISYEIISLTEVENEKN